MTVIRTLKLLAWVVLLSGFCIPLHAKDYLQLCVAKQVEPVRNRYIRFNYRENQNKQYHSPEPWQTMEVNSAGRVWYGPAFFMQSDTISEQGKDYISQTCYGPSALLARPYWSKTIPNVTQTDLATFPAEAARYNPALLIQYFSTHWPTAVKSDDPSEALYQLSISGMEVILHINKTDFLLTKVVTLQDNDLWGDVKTTYKYSSFSSLGKFYYPRKVEIVKIHDIIDRVEISAPAIVTKPQPLLTTPNDYIVEDEKETVETLSVEQVSPHIYLIHMKQAQSQVPVIVFSNFVTVIDVPLNSKNGELVLKEIKKIAPGKPIKYYAFGHHHPWALGGVRPFVLEGSTLLCRKESIDYVKFVTVAPHTLRPDSLQLHPKWANIRQIDDEITTITDGAYEMEVCFIGEKSKHTTDYVLFYFPAEKILIEGDLAWVPREGPVQKASERQAGLYHAIRDLRLPVTTVLQTWPDGSAYGVKSRFPFSELEQSVNTP